jgi:undecaprenyl-diphosphatase
MIEKLELIDRQLLLFFNGLHTPLLDPIMWFISATYTWVPLYLVLLFFTFRKASRSWWILLIGLIITIAASDLISVHCFKNVFLRYRPTYNLEIKDLIHIVNGYRGGQYGFISSHAANTFACATFVSFFFRTRWITFGMFLWASVVSFSRIYLGVHYPGDVACGALVGILVGYGGFYLYQVSQENERKVCKGIYR